MCAIGLVGLVMVSLVLADNKEAYSWQQLARPEHLTELYFTDYQELPHRFTPGKAQSLAFTVHNLEHKRTMYRYKLIAHAEDITAEQVVGDGTFTLRHDQVQTTRQTVTVPSLGSRMAVRIELEYEGGNRAGGASELQRQSIHYWAKVAYTGGKAGNV